MELIKIPLPFRVKKPVLALGSQTKNTLCFARGNLAYISPARADLSNPADFQDFEAEVKYFLKQCPKIMACDLHPEYQSTKYAALYAKRYRLNAIQHHHAHVASCMAENGLINQRVIGVAFDGTGWGEDNTFWGGEFLLADYQSARRMAHLRQIPLPGGEMAIRQPWRLAAVWLDNIYGDYFLKLPVGLVKKIKPKDWQLLRQICRNGYNSPLTSSMGRLFDALGSLILERPKAAFEAELAIGLEKLAFSSPPSALSYKFSVARIKDQLILDPVVVFKEIVDDLVKGVPQDKIAFRFHLTIAKMIRKTCLILRERHRLNKVVLSGGVFQNKLLLRLSLDLLYKEGFTVFTHQKLSSNDSGISLGQAVIAANTRPYQHPAISDWRVRRLLRRMGRCSRRRRDTDLSDKIGYPLLRRSKRCV